MASEEGTCERHQPTFAASGIGRRICWVAEREQVDAQNKRRHVRWIPQGRTWANRTLRSSQPHIGEDDSWVYTCAPIVHRWIDKRDTALLRESMITGSNNEFSDCRDCSGKDHLGWYLCPLGDVRPCDLDVDEP